MLCYHTNCQLSKYAKLRLPNRRRSYSVWIFAFRRIDVDAKIVFEEHIPLVRVWYSHRSFVDSHAFRRRDFEFLRKTDIHTRECTGSLKEYFYIKHFNIYLKLQVYVI